MTEAVRASLASLEQVVGEVPDPEVPALTIADLGILRSVVEVDGEVVVTITPTYSGCPAMSFIGDQVAEAAAACGYPDTRVELVLNPAWTTDWMTDEGKRKLSEFGIAPPRPVDRSPVPTAVSIIGRAAIPCPLCGSPDTELISEFSSTACKALYRCTSCAEPFDYFKEF